MNAPSAPDNLVMTSGFPLDARGESASLVSASSTRRDALRRQQTLVAIGRRVVAPPDVEILLHDVAAMLAEMLDAEDYLVAELSPGCDTLRVTATSQQPEGLKNTVYQTVAAGSESLAGHVLEVAHPMVIHELARETRFQDAWLRKQGVVSAIAVPMKLPDRAFGALIAGSRRRRSYDVEDLLFAETIAHLVTATLARIETERALETERQLATGVLETVGALVLRLDAQGRICHVNRACERVTGFAASELKGRPICDTLVVAEEVGLFQLILQKLQDGISPVECEGLLLTKHAQHRKLVWSYSAVSNSRRELQSIIASGIDITEQRQAEERATRAEEAAARARQVALNHQSLSEGQSPRTGGARPDAGRVSPAANGGEGVAMNHERRRRPRRSYPYRQFVAPVVDGAPPPDDAFVEIECNDIAAGGFSYLASQPPPSNSLIVALGSPPKLTYLGAEIVHMTRLTHDEQAMYLIGCAYTGRVNR